MDETIARLNIEHYRGKLSNEKDQAKRRTLEQLLAEEETKLAEIARQREHKKSG